MDVRCCSRSPAYWCFFFLWLLCAFAAVQARCRQTVVNCRRLGSHVEAIQMTTTRRQLEKVVLRRPSSLSLCNFLDSNPQLALEPHSDAARSSPYLCVQIFGPFSGFWRFWRLTSSAAYYSVLH